MSTSAHGEPRARAAAAPVILLHGPHGKSADLARLSPEFSSRAAARAALESERAPRTPGRRSRGAEFESLRGDRFLQRFARPDRRRVRPQEQA